MTDFLIEEHIHPLYYRHSITNARHFDLPLINRISLAKFWAPTLKPKRYFVFSFPRTGILSTPYLFLRIDGEVSTPFLILPILFLVSSSRISKDPNKRFLEFKDMTIVAVRFFSFGLHSHRCGQFSHVSLVKDTRALFVCFM